MKVFKTNVMYGHILLKKGTPVDSYKNLSTKDIRVLASFIEEVKEETKDNTKEATEEKDLTKLSYKELTKLAEKKGIPGYKKLKKADLIKALMGE